MICERSHMAKNKLLQRLLFVMRGCFGENLSGLLTHGFFLLDVRTFAYLASGSNIQPVSDMI